MLATEAFRHNFHANLDRLPRLVRSIPIGSPIGLPPPHASIVDRQIRNPLVENLPGTTATFENAPPPHRRSSWPPRAQQVLLSMLRFPHHQQRALRRTYIRAPRLSMSGARGAASCAGTGAPRLGTGAKGARPSPVLRLRKTVLARIQVQTESGRYRVASGIAIALCRQSRDSQSTRRNIATARRGTLGRWRERNNDQSNAGSRAHDPAPRRTSLS
jgi:hypothetical protein